MYIIKDLKKKYRCKIGTKILVVVWQLHKEHQAIKANTSRQAREEMEVHLLWVWQTHLHRLTCHRPVLHRKEKPSSLSWVTKNVDSTPTFIHK